MSTLYAGGLWSVFLITAISMGYVWALNLPRLAHKVLLGAAIVVIVISQLLPESHLFRIRVFEGLQWWFWAFIIFLPVFGYVLLLRWVKRKAKARDDSRGN